MSSKSKKAIPKIADFGLSKIMGKTQKANDPYGTLGYVSPEILQKVEYDFKTDIWSLGCVIYAMCCSCLPFDSDDKQEAINKTKEAPLSFVHPAWKNFSDDLIDLLTCMLEKSP